MNWPTGSLERALIQAGVTNLQDAIKKKIGQNQEKREITNLHKQIKDVEIIITPSDALIKENTKQGLSEEERSLGEADREPDSVMAEDDGDHGLQGKDCWDV